MSKYILFPFDAMDVKEVGGKAFALHELQDQNIPDWFVITPAAFHDMGSESDNPDSWMIPGELEKRIYLALEKLFSANDYFAVRSSAVDEDGGSFSFAGQLESYLGIEKTNLCSTIIKVWQSAFSERIKAYRHEHNLDACVPPAVIVQRLINARCAGVSFSVNPITGHWSRAIVSSVWGLGSSLVDGDVNSDTWQVDYSGKILNGQISHKDVGRYLENGHAVEVAHDNTKAGAASLTDYQVAEVATLARLCSKLRGAPQDIEWAYEQNELFLLQSRPITNLETVADPDGEIQIWDNSNIAESYGGVTTPLTYSFTQNIYEEVYRQFCKIMGVPKSVIHSNDATFRGLLGLMNGRMYYNLTNWYRLLACFPGFAVNRGFMEQMMGVQEDLGAELLELLPKNRHDNIFKSYFFLGKALLSMGFNHLFIRKKITAFYRRLERALEPPTHSLSNQRPDELVHSYRLLEKQLLLKWDAPLINDFFAMIFFGILSKLCVSWCGDENGTLQNELVGGSGQVISAEPAKRVQKMASLIKNDQRAIELFKTGTIASILHYVRNNSTLHRNYSDYLAKFGDRCLDELKLESVTLYDNPLPLLRAIGHFSDRKSTISEDHSLQARQKAEVKVKNSLQGKCIKNMFFNYILKHARARVEDRENLRFERTRLFGRVRQIMVELGRRFEVLGVLDNRTDIFYLHKDEILSYVSGFASCPDMRGLAALRKDHFDQYQKLPPIADRFKTKGMVFVGNDFTKDDVVSSQNLGASHRQGIGCCSGVVRGKVKVVRDPQGVELPAGCILVAERTDPGWIMLFPAAAGLLVEKGSLLSHSAIVARELGLPAVVSIPGITSWLQDGDEVEFNGSTGTVTLVRAVHG